MVEKEAQKGLIVFQDRKIRRLLYNHEWFYSVVDIIEILTDSPTPRQYWGKVKDREFIALELSPIWVQLKMPAEDGKLRYTDCVNTKNAFRLIQSIPSKKAEPFKMWLAQVGKERIEEIENPELSHCVTNEGLQHTVKVTDARLSLTEGTAHRHVYETSDHTLTHKVFSFISDLRLLYERTT